MTYEYITSSEFTEQTRDEVPLRGIWDGLKENTTAHGIPHVEIARGESANSKCRFRYLYSSDCIQHLRLNF